MFSLDLEPFRCRIDASFPWGGRQPALRAAGLSLQRTRGVRLLSGGERCVELHTEATFASGRRPQHPLTGLLNPGTIRRCEAVSQTTSEEATWPH